MLALYLVANEWAVMGADGDAGEDFWLYRDKAKAMQQFQTMKTEGK